MFAVIGKRSDVALRKLNVISWETPLAQHYLKDVPSLPYVVVYGRDAKRVRAVAGLDLQALGKVIDEGSAR